MHEPAVSGEGLPERYEREVRERHWSRDPAQWLAVARLEQLRGEWLARQGELGAAGRLLRRFWPRTSQDAPRGVYLWGGVGRGKTWLMDLFYDTLAPTARRRSHFHQLMRGVHAGLATIRMHQEPLRLVARRMARRATLWCIDELHVIDIADAMLLGALFEELLGRGVSLVITSNTPPAGLYRDGLQRARFLPAIALLENRLDVLHVDAGTDYRLRQLRQAPIYLAADEAGTRGRLVALFEELAGAHTESGRHLLINGRTLHATRRAGDIVWFSFATLCQGARSAADYAELAEEFHTVFLTEIPLLGEQQEDAVRRFIALIDALYDQGVKLIASAAAAPARLYQGARLGFEFRRTVSRLIEMQSEEYLARAHARKQESANIN
jgi:cell division protein ZapE